MLDYNQIKSGMLIEYKGSLYKVLSAEFLRMQQRKPVMRVKLKDIKTKKVKDMSFRPSDKINEIDIDIVPSVFIYSRNNKFWFSKKEDASFRFFFDLDSIGKNSVYLKQNMEVDALFFNENPIDIRLPAKVDLKVIDAPPSIKGNTSSGGSKVVVVETGAKVSVPFFIENGDIIRISTKTGEYTERISKG